MTSRANAVREEGMRKIWLFQLCCVNKCIRKKNIRRQNKKHSRKESWNKPKRGNSKKDTKFYKQKNLYEKGYNHLIFLTTDKARLNKTTGLRRMLEQYKLERWNEIIDTLWKYRNKKKQIF